MRLCSWQLTTERLATLLVEELDRDSWGDIEVTWLEMVAAGNYTDEDAGHDQAEALRTVLDRVVQRLKEEELDPTKITLTREQYEALLTFAQENGKRWKALLNVAWSTGRYDDYKGTDQYGLLQQIRNTFGPSWLVKFNFNNESTYTRKS